ncbi:ejaculatory bulb-specific protein 3-like [Temnothorax nylanderi]|uniref:ejaculatory bulb-specific protein 3-like n=1 Tax=Temnothorax nylanderi TaxID=102681 RepID=UPI003A861580
MARLSYVVLIIAMNVLMCVLAEEETYPKKYEEFDVQDMLRNSREQHLNCYLQIGPCTEEQRLMSEMFGEALQTDCKKCADGHRSILVQVRDWYLENLPEVWQQILVKSKDYVKKN